MTNTNPQPIPSVEEVVATFEGLVPEVGFEWCQGHQHDVEKLIRTILTARDLAHQEAMGEMDEVFIIFLNRVLRDKTDPRMIAAIVEDLREEIARSRGVVDKQ